MFFLIICNKFKIQPADYLKYFFHSFIVAWCQSKFMTLMSLMISLQINNSYYKQIGLKVKNSDFYW